MSQKTAKVNNESPFYQRWWFWVIIAFVILVVGVGGTSSNKGNNEDSSSTSSNSESSSNSTQTAFKVGEAFTMDGVEMKVTSVQRNFLPSNQLDRPSDGMEFVKVSMSIDNKSNNKVSYSASDWKMEDSTGDIKDYKITTEDGDLSYGELASGGKKSGFLIFEVPANDGALKIHYSPTWSFSNKEAIVNLQ